MKTKVLVRKRKSIIQTMQHNWQLWLLVLPALIWLFTFAYYPIYGLLIAFKDFNAQLGITGSPFAEPLFKHFSAYFSTTIAKTTITNTFMLSIVTLVFTFPVPIIFALVLNQIKGNKLRKTIQTVSYAPYFVSNVVVVSILSVICAPSGFVNTIYEFFTGETALFMSRPEYFRSVYVVSNIWQTMGFSAIIYIAALAGISPEYYEAAIVDGASRFKRIVYIDIPLIMPTVIIMLILSVGNIMTIGYEKSFLMQSGANLSRSEIISTYVYKAGLQSAQYSFATAIGLFNSIVNFLILIVTNQLSKRYANISIF